MSDSGNGRAGQAIKAIVSLIGQQDTDVAAHRPGTDGAAVSVRIGKTLIYLGDAETAVRFRRVWESGTRAVKSIPVTADATTVMPVAGVAEPSLMLEASGSPPATARLERSGRAGTLWVTLGRITFDVRDHAAFLSTMNAFQRAERLAARTFLRAEPADSRTQAADTAARLFEPRAAAAPRARRAAPLSRVAVAAGPAGAPVRGSIERGATGRVAR